MEENYVEELVASKGKSSVILAKYICDHDKYPDKTFCFFEGEDYKYYRSRIIQYLDIEEEEIFHYDCNGKKEVLKVYEDLLEDENVKKIFFIDKDFDEDIIKDKVFQTSCYSIENYYVTDSAFKHFLSTEFDINMNNKNFIKCLKDYTTMREKFNVIIAKLNAYIYYIRKRDSKNGERINLPKEKDILNKIIKKIEVDELFVYPEKSIDEIKEILQDDKEINVNEILALSREFETRTGKEMFFRGKFEIFFLKKFVTSLINKVKNEEYFEAYDKEIHIDINNNIITYLSSYADTFQDLKEFLISLKKLYFEK